MALLENVLIDADIDKGKMDEVILVGGSSQIPILREKISNFFDGKVRFCSEHLNPTFYNVSIGTLPIDQRRSSRM